MLREDDGGLSLHALGAAEFGRLRELLAGLGYVPAIVQERVNASLEGAPGRARTDSPRDPADVLIDLFVEEAALPAGTVEAFLPAEALGLLASAGLLERGLRAGVPTYRAPLALHPTGPLYLVSDHKSGFEATGPTTRPDMVYPPIASSTAEFVSALPVTPCERVLDLGAGTGIAALLAARTASHAWAADITERSTRMAEFNALLNGIGNVTAVQGDLYEPVAELTFDRIVAHPPYMPARGDGLIFRDGGEDGEEILQRIVAGLADHLRPGGRFYCRCMATDRRDGTLEQRIRGMLGRTADEFDVLVLAMTTKAPGPFYSSLLANGGMTALEFEEQMRLYRRLGVQNLVIGTLLIERHATPRTAVTARRQWPLGRDPDPDSADWLHRWEREQADDDGFDAKLLATRPALASGIEVQLRHRARAGELRAETCTITCNHPFRFTLEATPGAALLLVRCDGQRTVAELFRELQEMGALSASMPAQDFLQLIRMLLAGGVLEAEAFPLPQRPSAPGAAVQPDGAPILDPNDVAAR